MKRLVNLLKEIEIHIRSNTPFSKELYKQLAELDEWNLRIINDFILRVKMDLSRNPDNINFLYKTYDIDNIKVRNPEKKDLLIVALKRIEKDTVLTDVENRLVIPDRIKWNYMVIYGYPVTQARNLAVEFALKENYKFLLFIDDDIVAPNNALLKLWKFIHEYDFTKYKNYLGDYDKPLVVAANYYKKVEPLVSAHSYFKIDENDNIGIADNVCAMGFTLINIDEISKRVPLPLFWEFGAPDGYWSMGEDAFFTKNLIYYTKSYPLIDLTTECLHYDKTWKRIYGKRDNSIVYATNTIYDFETIRVSKSFPLILIGIPTRSRDSIIATDLRKVELLRGYRTEILILPGYNVDDARNIIAKEALRLGADYLFFLDDDIILGVDYLNRLIIDMENVDEDVAVITGDYTTKGYNNYSVHLNLNKSGLVTELDRLKEDDIIYYPKNKKLIESNWLIGLGCALIKTEVFKQIRPPWFKCIYKPEWSDKVINEDAWFSELVFENGYKILIDRSIQCLHVNFNENTIYYNNLLISNINSIKWATDLDLSKFKFHSNVII